MHKQNNRASVTGHVLCEPEIDHVLYGRKFYRLILGVHRLSKQMDELPILLPEHMLQDAPLFFGSKIYVLGQIRSYNKYRDGKNHLIVTIFAHQIHEEQDVHEGNDVLLCGSLCKPPTYRFTPFGREISDLLIAVPRPFQKSDYIPCIVWGEQARMAQSFDVGEYVGLQGRLQSRAYEKLQRDGNKIIKTAYEVSVSRLWVSEKEP